MAYFEPPAILLLCHQRCNRKVCHYNYPQQDTVISKQLEIISLYITHQKFDGIYRYQKCNYHGSNQIEYLDSGKHTVSL